MNFVYEGEHVKLNQEDVEEQPVDGKYRLDSYELSDHRQPHENIHEEAKSQGDELEPAQPDDYQSEAEPHEEESEEAGLRHGKTKYHKKEYGSVKANQDKLNDNKTPIKKAETKSGSIKTRDHDKVHDNKTSVIKADKKSHKKGAKIKFNMHGKKLNKITHKQTNHANPRKKASTAIPKVIHLSDNEIQSN